MDIMHASTALSVAVQKPANKIMQINKAINLVRLSIPQKSSLNGLILYCCRCYL